MLTCREKEKERESSAVHLPSQTFSSLHTPTPALSHPFHKRKTSTRPDTLKFSESPASRKTTHTQPSEFFSKKTAARSQNEAGGSEIGAARGGGSAEVDVHVDIYGWLDGWMGGIAREEHVSFRVGVGVVVVLGGEELAAAGSYS